MFRYLSINWNFLGVWSPNPFLIFQLIIETRLFVILKQSTRKLVIMWREYSCLFFLIFSTVGPLFALIGGLVGALKLLQGISHQIPSNMDIITVFFAGILGAIAGGFIGNISYDDNNYYSGDGWEFNLLPFCYTFWGLALGGVVISFLMSYIMATGQLLIVSMSQKPCWIPLIFN